MLFDADAFASRSEKSVVRLEKWSQEFSKRKMLETIHSKYIYSIFFPSYKAIWVYFPTMTQSSSLHLFRALTFVYPYGATLSVIKPAVAVLSTGSVCFPLHRPVLAFYHGKVCEVLLQVYAPRLFHRSTNKKYKNVTEMMDLSVFSKTIVTLYAHTNSVFCSRTLWDGEERPFSQRLTALPSAPQTDNCCGHYF